MAKLVWFNGNFYDSRNDNVEKDSIFVSTNVFMIMKYERTIMQYHAMRIYLYRTMNKVLQFEYIQETSKIEHLRLVVT